MPTLYPNVCARVGLVNDQQDERGFNSPAGCPWEVQRLLWAWFKQVREHQNSAAFFASCWRDEMSSEVLLEILRQRFEHFEQDEVLAETMTMYKRWAESRAEWPEEMRGRMQYLLLTFVRHTRPLFARICEPTFDTAQAGAGQAGAGGGGRGGRQPRLLTTHAAYSQLQRALSLLRCVLKQELEVPSWQAMREYLAELMDLYLSAGASKATVAVLADVVEETMELVLTAWLNCVTTTPT